jgi:hypothetical protein
MFAAGAISAMASDTASLKKAAPGLGSLRHSRAECKNINHKQDSKRFHGPHHITPMQVNLLRGSLINRQTYGFRNFENYILRVKALGG